MKNTLTLSGLIVLLIMLSGCYAGINSFNLLEVTPEKRDLDHSVRSDSMKIVFSVLNNGELTLTPKIEVKLNETCFSRVNDRELDEIPPKQSIRTFVTVSLKGDIPETCEGKEFFVKLYLKDINGKELAKENIPIGII